MLNREEIKKLVEENSLVKDYVDLESQLTPNGIDLTAGKVYAFDSSGSLDFSNKERILPACRELKAQKDKPEDRFGWWRLEKGCYKIVTNETVTLPKTMIGVAFSRSSLLRMGAFVENGVWDAGFSGKSEFILVVENPAGMRLKENARVIQLLFMPIEETGRGYSGIYQHL
jgi:dUTP pyrophosphatase